MTETECIDYMLLTLAVNCDKDWGLETRPFGLLEKIRPYAPTVSEAAIIDRCKVLFPDLLKLQKRDAAGNFRSYAGEHEDEAFFDRGDFYLKRTAKSRERLDQLAQLIEPEQAAKGPYGFPS